jgi:hypothetical protein
MAGWNSHEKSYTCSLVIIVAMLVSCFKFVCGFLYFLIFEHFITKIHE